MATALGAGTALATAWSLEPVCAVRALPSEAPRAAAPAPPVERPAGDTEALLARIAALLATVSLGLPLSDLRARLSEPSDSVQRALAAGLRMKRLRRVGAHNKLRYLLNA